MKTNQKLSNSNYEKHLQVFAINGSLFCFLTWVFYFWLYQQLSVFSIELTGWPLIFDRVISQMLVFALVITPIVVGILISQGIQATLKLRRHRQIILKEIQEYLNSLEAKGNHISTQLRKRIINQVLKTGFTGLD